MFKRSAIVFLLFELLLAATVKRADQNALADVESDSEALQKELIAQQSNWPPSQTGKCPRGFTYLPSTGSCYKVVYESHDWYSAGRKCQQLRSGSHLVAITSAEENSAVKAFLASETSKNVGNTACFLDGHTSWGFIFWTSGQQLIKSNCRSPFVWKQSSEKLEAFEYTNWNGGEPNCGSGEFCVNIPVYNNFRWVDDRCSAKTCPLCEYTP